MNSWPFNSSAVASLKVFNLICWHVESEKIIGGIPNDGVWPCAKKPVFGIPPLQRSAVWKPKQVVDLWDSLLRGLPIGMFYLLEQTDPRDLKAGQKITHVEAPGYDLLDGQQRLRALRIGINGYEGLAPEEKRCLWVEFIDPNKNLGKHFRLRITTKSQPFGYDPESDGRLGAHKKWDAREKIGFSRLKICDENGAAREVHDLDLFDEKIAGLKLQPPLPYGAERERCFKLHDLIQSWNEAGGEGQADKKIAAIHALTGSSLGNAEVVELHKAFERVEEAEVALLRVSQGHLQDRKNDILELFQRIGAGGTPLTETEKLYSMYKSDRPHIFTAVNEIYKNVGRVLTPTHIAETAIRIAAASVDASKNDGLSVGDFARTMTNDRAGDQGKDSKFARAFAEKLDKLIPNGKEASRDSLLCGFKRAMDILQYNQDAGDFWIPDIMLAFFPKEIWHVLVFWTVECANGADDQISRKEAVRFVLFWYLAVDNNEKAARWCFERLKNLKETNQDGRMNFPGKALYETLTDGRRSDRACAIKLINAARFKELTVNGEAVKWRTYHERFHNTDANGDVVHNELGSRWWHGGKKNLPWLQRNYMKEKFPNYMPLSAHEDDLPYDIDHICPQNDFNQHWTSMEGRLDKGAVSKESWKGIRDNRWLLGNSIGNLRLLDAPENRGRGNEDVAILLEEGQLLENKRRFLLAVDEQELGFWGRVATGENEVGKRLWTDDRLMAFQHAVELRSASLYAQFFSQLAFCKWVP